MQEKQFVTVGNVWVLGKHALTETVRYTGETIWDGWERVGVGKACTDGDSSLCRRSGSIAVRSEEEGGSDLGPHRYHYATVPPAGG